MPIISPASTSPAFSDGEAFPYFLRTPPSDSFVTKAMVDILQLLWNYSSVALVHSTDAYGAGGAITFTSEAASRGLQIRITVSFAKDATDFSVQLRALRQSGARVAVLFCPMTDGGRLLNATIAEGIGGAGYLWFGGDTFASPELWTGDPEFAANPELRLKALKGLFAAMPEGHHGNSTIYQRFIQRRRQLFPTTGAGNSCNLQTDDAGEKYLWASNGTEIVCAGDDPTVDGPYDTFAYDAAFAIGHALHDVSCSRYLPFVPTPIPVPASPLFAAHSTLHWNCRFRSCSRYKTGAKFSEVSCSRLF